jgi:dihydroorotase-like cyclic amidohydrolase
MKQKELSGRMDFLDKNPEVTLPVNLDSVLTDNEQPESSNASQVVNAPLKDKSKVESSWAQVVANGLETSNNSNNSNERCNLEH